MVTLVGECEVEYDGRAASYLGPGERLVILKSDGTLLVHRDKQRKPVNWQPPGSTHSARVDGDRLIVESVRTSRTKRSKSPSRRSYRPHYWNYMIHRPSHSKAAKKIFASEFLKNPDVLEEGFQAMMTERETSAGAVDIYGKDADGTPTIVELKRRRVGPNEVGQLNRYVAALERNRPNRTIRGISIAPSVTNRAEELLATEDLEFISLTVERPEPSQPTGLTEFDSE